MKYWQVGLKGKKKTLEKRAQLLREIREWFFQHNFLEVNTPLLLPHSSLEKEIYPLVLSVENDLGETKRAFLRSSPEFSLKKLLAAGYPKLYELGACFRNRESWKASTHSCEFTLLEWYELGCDLQGMMESFTSFMRELAERLSKKIKVSLTEGLKFQRWERLSVREAFLKFAGLDFNAFKNWDEFLAWVNNLRAPGRSQFYDLDEAFHWLFLEKINPVLEKKAGVLLYHYPNFQAAFSKPLPTDQRYALRFEAYWAGLELANAFEELTNAEEQEKLLLAGQQWHRKHRRQGGVDSEVDRQFIAAVDRLGKANTPCAGIAVGVERMLMALLDAEEIDQTMTFSSRTLFS